ncbi:MAG: UDP-4-amino-4,6-dideoxy-N-acetyl-beta-L-altrosamine transaminase [Deltaproteobacteria bacterium]|nr:UDP-4-amino-4,6-dideoxy-N-acetyl-beta-L-altrosamine transaminase [Deltaproteobacteria bacterium]
MISYGRQTIEADDIEAVVKVLASGMLTQGPVVEEFERKLAAYTGAKYAVVCANGTAALHLACKAAGLGPGDKVLTTPLTFLATANAALYVGAAPVFVDIDPDTLNIDFREAEKKVMADHAIKAMIPVHFAGSPFDVEEAARISRQKNLILIEDACHALGASWTDSAGEVRKVGSSSHSDMTVFSFHPVKSITTGEGGAITTNSRRLHERLTALRAHGVIKDPARLFNPEGLPWYYEMQDLGFNYRLTDMQSALGVSQLNKLDKFIARRKEISSLYGRLLSKYPFIKTPVAAHGCESAWHLYPVRIDFNEVGASKKEFFELMKSIGINLQVHYIPVHLQPYYRALGFKPGDFPAAESFYSEEVSLPIYPLLADEEAGAVVEALLSTLACASVKPRKALAI